MGLVTGQKRELRGAQQVLRGMFKKLRAMKALDERIGFPVGTQERKEFERGLEIRAFLLLVPLEFWLAHALLLPSFNFPRGRSLALPPTWRHLHKAAEPANARPSCAQHERRRGRMGDHRAKVIDVSHDHCH
jgi:hypothetical protein